MDVTPPGGARLLLKACAVALRLAGVIALAPGIAALRARWNQRSHRSAA